MTERGSHAVHAPVIKRYGPKIIEGQLQFAGALLHSNQTGHRTVNLACQPLLACHFLKLQHCIKVSCRVRRFIGEIFLQALQGGVIHDRPRRLSEEVGELQVNGSVATGRIKEGELAITCHLPDDIYWSPFAAGH